MLHSIHGTVYQCTPHHLLHSVRMLTTSCTTYCIGTRHDIHYIQRRRFLYYMTSYDVASFTASGPTRPLHVSPSLLVLHGIL
jgi:hypothetical protein